MTESKTTDTLIEKYSASMEKMAGPEAMAHAQATRDKAAKGDVAGAAAEYFKTTYEANKHSLGVVIDTTLDGIKALGGSKAPSTGEKNR